jgi:membrane associated rhomboid family serine protease
MLHDRDYMRSPSYESRFPLAVRLIILLIVLFVIQECLMFYGEIDLYKRFALSLDGFKQGHLWQLLTFQFLHSGPWPWHLLGNCLGLYFFGRTVEETLGKKTFLGLYFASGFFGAAVELFSLWLQSLHNSDFAQIQVVGASAGVMGLLAAYAFLFPMREITIFLYFFPITIRAQYLFWAALLFSIYGTIIPYSNVADAAHLGGLLMGVAYARWGHEAQRRLSRLDPFQSRQRKLELVKASSAPFRPRPKREPLPELPSEEFITKEVDPILDKISAHGIQSLTQRERQILEAARARISKR